MILGVIVGRVVVHAQDLPTLATKHRIDRAMARSGNDDDVAGMLLPVLRGLAMMIVVGRNLVVYLVG